MRQVLVRKELRFLLGSAYTRFYMRPSFLANYLRITAPRLRAIVGALDERVHRRHARAEGLEALRLRGNVQQPAV